MLELKGRALTRLRYGPCICVDLGSLDALPYLVDSDIEIDVIPVFQAFLRPDSVVLDIGANFGLYTALAGAVALRRGHVYAFEANPEVFRCLQGTILANRFWPGLRIHATNVLVADRCGRGTLYYDPDVPLSGTMSNIPLTDVNRSSVEVDMMTIDAYLPRDLVVDLVKIDVEGHEPSVLRGMAQTIARSPRIRVIIEFSSALLQQTVGAEEFVRQIHSLGLDICRIMPDATLRLASSHTDLPEFGYCLLTRTPEPDIAFVEARRNSPAARLRRWLRRHLPQRPSRLRLKCL
jgi:FkbM family methyltransferase